MPTLGQATDDHADLLAFDCGELHKLAIERRRKDSDNSNLGIPAEDDSYFRGLVLYTNPETGLPSKNQGSWETISTTSHELSKSSPENPSVQPILSERKPLSTSTIGPPTTFNETQTLSTSETNAPYTPSNPGSSSSGWWNPDLPSSSQTRSGPSETVMLTPNTLSPAGEYSDSQMWETPSQTESIEIHQDYHDSSPYTGLDYSQGSLNQEDYRRHFSEDLGAISVPKYDGVDTLFPVVSTYNLMPKDMAGCNSNPQLVRADNNQNTTLASRGRKRKSPGSSPRKDLNEINAVRKSGACFRCAVLKEKVGNDICCLP